MESVTPEKVEAWTGPHGTLHTTKLRAMWAFEYDKYLKYISDNTLLCPQVFVSLSNVPTYEWLYNHLEELQKLLRPD